MQRMRPSFALAVLFTFLLAPGLADFAFAGEFEGLQPGVLNKADADRVLGAPVREVIRGERYDYDPAKHDSRRISIRYHRNTQIILAIDIYLKTNYAKEKYQEWFRLGKPAKTEFDQNGNVVEYYSAEGLALHYAGPDEKSPVEFFSHFDPGILTRTLEPAAPAPPKPQPPAPVPTVTMATEPPTVTPTTPPSARLGLLIRFYEGSGLKVMDVQPSSPAARAGLRSEDVILEFGSTRLYETKIPPARLSSLLAGLKPGQALHLLIQRGTDRFETAVIPDERKFDPKRTELAKMAYDQARKLMDAGDFSGAAGYFSQAISHDPDQPAGYAGLAESCYRRGDKTGEIEALKRGVTAAPGYRLYSLLGFAFRRAERFDEAIEAFGKAFMIMPADVKDTMMLEQYGFCQMKKRRYQEALAPLESAYKINPRSPATVYLLGGCHDSLNNREQAMNYFRSYLGLGDSDKERIKFARRRLDALTKGPDTKGSAGEQLLNLIDSMIKEASKIR